MYMYTWKVSSTQCTVLWSISSPVTVQDIVPPHCKKNEHTLDNLCGKCLTIVPVLLQPQHINLERCAALSHTPALLQQLFIYSVALNAAISSELPHARSLTSGRIPELFKRHRPSANTRQKFSLLARITMKFYYTKFFLRNIFNLNIFQFTVYNIPQN